MRMRYGKVAMFTFVENGKIFLQERWDYSKTWEEWSFFWGHLEPWEDFLQGCIREVQEELWIDISEDDIEYIGEFRNLIIWESDYQSSIYICKKYSKFRDLITIQEWESGKFFDFSEIYNLKMFSHDYMVCDNIKKFLNNEV